MGMENELVTQAVSEMVCEDCVFVSFSLSLLYAHITAFSPVKGQGGCN